MRGGVAKLEEISCEPHWKNIFDRIVHWKTNSIAIGC